MSFEEFDPQRSEEELQELVEAANNKEGFFASTRVRTAIVSTVASIGVLVAGEYLPGVPSELAQQIAALFAIGALAIVGARSVRNTKI